MKWRTASNLSRALPRNRSIAAVRLLRFRRRAFRPTASGPVTPFACPPVMEGSTTARCWSSPRASAMSNSGVRERSGLSAGFGPPTHLVPDAASRETSAPFFVEDDREARLSGINIDWVKIVVYTLSGLLSSLAGFVLIARIGATEPIGGNGFELQAIGAAVIGGASLFGGVGNPLGSLIGALTLGGLQNGLTLMNVPSFWQYVASGVVVILAVYGDRLARPRR
jgi:hypothetical protein